MELCGGKEQKRVKDGTRGVNAMGHLTAKASALAQRAAKKSKNQNQLARDIGPSAQTRRGAEHPKNLRESNQRRGTRRYCSLCFLESSQNRFFKNARTCRRKPIKRSNRRRRGGCRHHLPPPHPRAPATA